MKISYEGGMTIIRDDAGNVFSATVSDGGVLYNSSNGSSGGAGGYHLNPLIHATPGQGGSCSAEQMRKYEKEVYEKETNMDAIIEIGKHLGSLSNRIKAIEDKLEE